MPRKRQALRCSEPRHDGTPCKGYAIIGATVCAAHGGRLPRVKAAAAASVVERRVAAELARLDVEPVDDPLAALAILAGQILAWRDAMADRVAALTSLRYEGIGAGEQLRAEVALWERALDRAERVLVAMARLNIDERLARISERQVAIMERAVRATLAEMGLDLEAQDDAARKLGRHLRAV